MRVVKSFFVLSSLLFLGLASPLRAQSLDTANQYYQTFMSLNSSNGGKDLTYDALYRSYHEYLSILNGSVVGSQSYIQAKNRLRGMVAHMRNGAIYYSQNDNPAEALRYTQAYIDIPLMNAFETEVFEKDNYYPTMVYFAASGTYNTKDYVRANTYFREYLDTGDERARQKVFLYMAKSCMNINNLGLAKIVLDEAIKSYPSDYDMLSMAINCCIDTNDNENLQKYLTRALALRPNDNTLINIQGKLYEENFEFKNALSVYSSLFRASPNSIEIAKHLAINYFNLGVTYNNLAMTQTDNTLMESNVAESDEYFRAAIDIIERIIATDPTSVKYLQALAISYSCIKEFDKTAELNKKIVSLGGGKVSGDDIPLMLTFNDSKATAKTTAEFNTGDMPLFSDYAKGYIEHNLLLWQTKDPYETVEEYQKRVNTKSRDNKINELLEIAEAEYLAKYTADAKFTNMSLKPYDAENRVFLAESAFGEVIIPVPRENNEAKVFESGWAGTRFKNPEFYISNNKILVSSLEIITPTGKTYKYDSDKNLNYTETKIDINFESINNDVLAMNESRDEGKGSKVTQNIVTIGNSDVDTNIPVSNRVNDRTFAVIISNENYQMVGGVPMALNDGSAFSQYCKLTLGLPESNIRFYPDATYGKMLSAMRDIRDISNAFNNDIEVIFYYAGHGIPDEATRSSFLLPVDSDGQQTEGCFSLDRLYDMLGAMKTRGAYVFLDACFSGSKRTGGTLSSTSRGVAIKSRPSDPKGNMVVFSAASDDQTALPLEEKGHGLFTYYLLKKLQDTQGDVTLQELGEYVIANVKSQSVVVNRKLQTPTITPSASMVDAWYNIKLIH
ncbi:MAG: caspase family protein [Rikenellaceae bacterium]